MIGKGHSDANMKLDGTTDPLAVWRSLSKREQKGWFRYIVAAVVPALVPHPSSALLTVEISPHT